MADARDVELAGGRMESSCRMVRSAPCVLGQRSRSFMSNFGAVVLGVFCLAMAVESAVWMTCLHRLKTRHPQQWRHAAQPALWQDRTLLSARSTILYLHNREYLSSMDREGMNCCSRSRTVMLAAYWLTSVTGTATLAALAVHVAP